MEDLQQDIIHSGISYQQKQEKMSLHKKWEEKILQEEKLWH